MFFIPSLFCHDAKMVRETHGYEYHQRKYPQEQCKNPPTHRALKEALRWDLVRTIFLPGLEPNRFWCFFLKEPFFGNINHIKLVFFLYEITHPDSDGMVYRICSGRGMHNYFSTTCGNTDNGAACNANCCSNHAARFRYRDLMRGAGILWLCTGGNATSQIPQM